jgi:hypothetical protein
MLQLLARRAAESNVFLVPDRNTLWIRVEDDLLVQAVGKYSTSDVLGRDWSEVASELPGRSKQQCKERYRLPDTVEELTFVFIRVIFLGFPVFRSSFVLTKVTDSSDSARPIYYSTFDASPPSPVPSLSTYLSVYDNRDGISEHADSPSSPSSLTHVHHPCFTCFVHPASSFEERYLSHHCVPGVFTYDQPYMKSRHWLPSKVASVPFRAYLHPCMHFLSYVNWMDENTHYVHRAHTGYDTCTGLITNTDSVFLTCTRPPDIYGDRVRETRITCLTQVQPNQNTIRRPHLRMMRRHPPQKTRRQVLT